MDRDALRALIRSDEQAVLFAFRGSDEAGAARCVEIAPLESLPTFVVYRGLASATGIGVDAARRLVVSVRAAAGVDPLVDEMQSLLRRSNSVDGIDVSDPGVQGMLDQLAAQEVAGGLTAGDAASIKAMCMRKPVITAEDFKGAR